MDIGKNELENSEVVMLDKIVTGFSGICTKISAVHEVDPKILTQIEIEFDKKFTQSKKDLPTLQVYITSEENSYGILFNEWLDGEEFLLTFKWVQYDDYNGLKYKWNPELNSYPLAINILLLIAKVDQINPKDQNWCGKAYFLKFQN